MDSSASQFDLPGTVPGFVTVHEVAALLGDTAKTGSCDPRLVEWLLQANPVTAALMARLRQLAADAGATDSPIWADLGLWYSERLDALLGTEGWQDPNEIIDPEEGCSVGVLLKVLNARLARGQGDPERLLAVRDRLERAHRSEQRAGAAGTELRR
ncbi:MAG: hypothetical protein GY856_54495, partial [bacterium]|nr:hypothetical protein [bacterium]